MTPRLHGSAKPQREDPQESRPVDRRARTRLLPADGPLGVVSAPRNSRDLPWSCKEVPSYDPRAALDLTTGTAGCAHPPPTAHRPGPSTLSAGTPARISQSNRVGPSGQSAI